MGRMVRKQVYIKHHHEAILKHLARTRGVSEAELIRQAIDQQATAGQARALSPDPVAWEEAYQYMLTLRARGPLTGERRTWERNDLYKERLSRYERDPD